ncbi:MAG: PmeII family type II restriction endonuclease [Limisphaerales bacterium]
MPNKMGNALFDALRSPQNHYNADEIARLFSQVSEERVKTLAAVLNTYITQNLPSAIEKRDGLADYRTNPYVMLTCASIMKLDDTARFADFLFNNKLYMGLETSFGKSIEAGFVGAYPLNRNTSHKWIEPPEKANEAANLTGLSREEKARLRTASVWREIDKSCVVGTRRYMTSIKSGPNCINDTQVQGMTTAIIQNYRNWLTQTRQTYPKTTSMDVVIGLTYGTDKTTNNKENQVLIKLLDHGFIEEDRARVPGVLIDSETKSVRVYRRIGKEFWAFIGNPAKPHNAAFVFLEVILALAKALSSGMEGANLEERINRKIQALATALGHLMFPRNSLPRWLRTDFSESQLFWFATALSAFYDEGV